MHSIAATGAESNDPLQPRQQHMITVSALAASGDMTRLRPAMDAALDGGLTVNEIRELMVHLYAYAGFPRSLNGINLLMEVLQQRKAAGKTDDPGPGASPLPADYDAMDYGNRTRNQLVGRDLTDNPAGYAQFAPVIDRFLKAHLFGDVFARDVLSHQQRELATISILAAMPGTEAQLQGHLKIAMGTGLTAAQLVDFAHVLESRVSTAAAQRTRAILDVADNSAGADSRALKVHHYREASVQPGPKEYFTGGVRVESLFASAEANSYSGGMVHFETGAHTAWHTHPLGQTLLVTDGEGRVQKQGEPVQRIRKGDVVWIPPNVRHWHGAAPDAAMSHVAIADALDGRSVTWLEHVSEAEYSAP